MAPSDQIRSNSSFWKGRLSIEPTIPFTLSCKPDCLALRLKISIKSGKRSSPVICPGMCPANTIVCPPVPQPMSAIRDLSVRLSIKLSAFSVTSGLPGPWRSILEKKSQINLSSKSWIVLFSLLIFLMYFAYTESITMPSSLYTD